MTRKEDFLGAMATLFLGALGLAVFLEAIKPKCPRCDNRINRGIERCPNCNALLEWR